MELKTNALKGNKQNMYIYNVYIYTYICRYIDNYSIQIKLKTQAQYPTQLSCMLLTRDTHHIQRYENVEKYIIVRNPDW